MSRWPLPPEYPGEYPLVRTPLPGPNARATIERDRRTVSQNLSKDVPLVVARGQGMVIEDVDGNRFLDFAAGISTVSTGHCHPDVGGAGRGPPGRRLHAS
jgi:4-aminobutyrate aminotransferase